MSLPPSDFNLALLVVDVQEDFCPPDGSLTVAKLLQILDEKKITHVYVVGLAQDYCVKDSALDSVRFSYKTFVVQEGTKAVDPGEGWIKAENEMLKAGVEIVGIDGKEVGWVMQR